MELYIDGALLTSTTPTGTFNDTLTATIGRISNLSSARYFSGQIDEIKVWKKALSAEDVSGEYLRQNLIAGSENDRSPVLKHNFDQKSGTSALDSSGNSFNATLFNMDSTNWVKGKSGNALLFNGSNEYGTIANQTLLNSTDFSVSAWFKTTSTSQGRILTKESNTNGRQRYSLGVNVALTGRAEVRFDSGTPVIAQSTSTINDGNWHHILGTFSDSNNRLRLYIDGRLETTTTTALTPEASSNPVDIGRFDGSFGHYFNGTIDQIRYWNRELTPREAVMEYSGGSTIAWYKFDENEGNTAYDHSGNAAHGTLSNMSPASDWQDEANCQNNGCLSFSGGNDYIGLTNESLFDFERTSQFSVCTWARFNNITDTSHTLAGKLDGTNRGWEFTAYDGATGSDGLLVYLISTWPSNRITNIYDNALSANRWYHLCLTYDGSVTNAGVKVYRDGQLLTPTSTTNTLSGTMLQNAPAYVGGRTGGSGNLGHNGRMDEMKIWNYELTQEDINREYTSNGAALRYE
ncbi:MAG: Laminin G domain protein [candidate division WS6 bacterium OLB20]|uniref:Laminin G domain protein n=1 Tax=candidate division WS6 bacterium OLB20 TaxID=1617426 RepID=A0A136LWI6_9BACT|nr:MAG: Laminin G domain protein [candidate division WS6 bacterium OLB20]